MVRSSLCEQASSFLASCPRHNRVLAQRGDAASAFAGGDRVREPRHDPHRAPSEVQRPVRPGRFAALEHLADLGAPGVESTGCRAVGGELAAPGGLGGHLRVPVAYPKTLVHEPSLGGRFDRTHSPLGRGRPGRPQVVAASVIVMLATRRCGVLYTYRRQVQELQIHLWPLPAGTGAGFLSLSGLHPSTLLIAAPVGSCGRGSTTWARAREPFRCARTRAGPHRRRLGSPGAAPRSSRGCCCAALARRPSAAAGRRERRRRP